MNALFAEAILIRSLVLFLMVGSAAGILTGILMLWRPDWLASMNLYLNRWVSTRKMARPLERQVAIDHWFYRNGRMSGILLLAGALYIVYNFTAAHGRVNFLSSLNGLHLLPIALLESLLDALVLIFLSGAVLAAIFSLFLIFRPSMLRDWELGANQPLSMRSVLKPMEIQHQQLDQLVFRNARLTGLLVLCGSLYTLIMLGIWLAK